MIGLYIRSVQQQPVETAAAGVRLHLRGRVWVQPEFPKARWTLPRTASSPDPAPQLEAQQHSEPRLQRGDGSWWSGDEAPYERARGVHQGLDSTQRGDSQVLTLMNLCNPEHDVMLNKSYP